MERDYNKRTEYSLKKTPNEKTIIDLKIQVHPNHTGKMTQILKKASELQALIKTEHTS